MSPGAITGIVGGAVALGSSIYGGIRSSSLNKKARKLLEQQRQENEDWYNTKMSEDYTRRSDAQAVLNKQRELLEEQYRNARATNVVAGGTDAGEAMQKAAANDAMAQTMSDIASSASAHRDAAEQQYRAQDAAITQQEMQTYQQQAQQVAQAASQAANAGTQIAGSGFNQLFKKDA